MICIICKKEYKISSKPTTSRFPAKVKPTPTPTWTLWGTGRFTGYFTLFTGTKGAKPQNLSEMRLLPLIAALVFFLNALAYFLTNRVVEAPRPPEIRPRRDQCTYCWPSGISKSERDSIRANNYERFQTMWHKIPYNGI